MVTARALSRKRQSEGALAGPVPAAYPSGQNNGGRSVMDSSLPWWQTCFSGLMLEALRTVYTESMSQPEAEFLVQVLAPAPGARIADVPCGGGRLSLALAARGFDLTGVDLTAALVEEASRAARERGLPATFHRRDMRDLPWEAAFDHAFCFGNSFGYFDEVGNADFLRAVRRILKPAGTFALETHFIAETLFPQPLGRRWYPTGDVLFLHDTHYDPATARLTSEYIGVRGGQVERKQAVYQVYTYRELMRLFDQTGFQVVETYGSLKREPFRLGSSGLWVVARRPE
jgi:SAM-dependent methyltransferase